ncbi:MAG: ABC transporter permease subunit [Bacilli bacterium]
MKKFKLINYLNFTIAFFFLFFIVIPLGQIFIKIGDVNLVEFLSTKIIRTALENSICLTLISTVISMCIGFILAFLVNRIDIKNKIIFNIIFSIPMLVPSISHGMGLIFLFGTNGIFTLLFSSNQIIYGTLGIILGSIMYSFPIAFIMFSDIFRYEDFLPHQAAIVLGVSKASRFIKLTLPYLLKPLASIFFAVFTMIITDYGIPLIVGGKIVTLPMVMYQEVVGRLNFNIGSVIGLLLLIPALLGFIFDHLISTNNNNKHVITPFKQNSNKKVKILSTIVCVIFSVLVLLPILSFCFIGFIEKYPSNMIFSFVNINKFSSIGGLKYLANSVLIAIFVAVIGTGLSFVCAYFTSRMKNRFTYYIHLLSLFTLAVPGIVLGLSYVMMFKETPLYGTISILIFVNIIHFFASPYLLAYNSLTKINNNIESVGKTLGIRRKYIFLDVIIPQTFPTILEMSTYYFVNSMMTISAVAFLSNYATKPVSLMLTSFESQGMIECAAIVSVIILMINVLLKIFIQMIKRKWVEYDN